MRRLAPKVGRPCTVCCHPKRAKLEAAVTAGTSLRAIRKNYGVSPWALLRHRVNHMRRASPPIPRRDLWPPGRTVARDASGNVVIDGCGRVTNTDGTGGSSPAGNTRAAPVGLAGPTGGPLMYPVRWWGPDTPRPGMGVRCEKCRRNDFWDVANWWGGCSYCWNPAITDGRKRTFRT